MISSYSITKKGKTRRDLPLRDFKKCLKSKDTILWVDMENPSKDELSILSDVFEFHPLAIEDAAKTLQLPKIDDHGDYLFVVFHKTDFDKEKETLKLHEIDFFLGKNFIISIHKKSKDVINQVIDKLEKNPVILKNGPDFLMHNIMDEVIDNYFPLLDYWEDKTIKIEEQVTKGKTDKVLDKLIKLKREFTELRKSLGPQRDLINRLARGDYKLISQKTTMYFKDIYDHIFRIYTTLESHNDLSTVIFDAYLTTVSMKMNETSNNMAVIMQRLTIISTIFLPLTFIASVYGMNFSNMPELGWKYGYFGILAFMCIIAYWMFRLFKKKHLW